MDQLATLEKGAVSTTHPDYDDALEDWELVRDSIAGETEVKSRGQTYLPMPSGFTQQTDGGVTMYQSYKLRARFPEIMGPTLRGMVGIIHRVPAEITLPKKLEPLREKATKDGLPLDALHERITYEVLAMGRYGLLVDAPETGADYPYIAGYRAETIINWSNEQDFYVLDETHLARDGFDWKEVAQYRVLELDNGVYRQEVQTATDFGDWGGNTVNPQQRGGKKLNEIPFVTIGSTDVTPEIDEIPLLAVARCSFTMYRLDADYKHQLYMSGQETLFVYTDTDLDIKIVGAGVIHKIAKESNAEYVGPSCKGIEAHKDAISDEREAAIVAGSRIFDTTKKTAESGEALRMRWTAQTASLTTVALNAAKGLERTLKYAALMVGANPDEVSVKPNLRFIDAALDPLKAKALMELWMGGAISGMTLWENLQRGDIGNPDRSWEEEQDLIEKEIPATMPATAPTAPTAPTASNAPSGTNTGGGTTPSTALGTTVPQR